jgi:hypothetical protein
MNPRGLSPESSSIIALGGPSQRGSEWMSMHFVILPVLPAWGCGVPSGLVGPTLMCIPSRTRVWPHLAQVAVFSIVRTVAPQEQKGKLNCCVSGALNSDLIRALVIVEPDCFTAYYNARSTRPPHFVSRSSPPREDSRDVLSG